METVGIFSDLESAAAAVDDLRAAGFPEARITSHTSVPYPNGVLVHAEVAGWFRWVALGGAVFGAISGFALAAGTAWIYPVQTGDKPIIALFPTAIITYEITMLCAILGTMIGMFLEMKLPPGERRHYDEAVSEGSIGIAVTAESDQEYRQAQELLKRAGALRVTEEGTL